MIIELVLIVIALFCLWVCIGEAREDRGFPRETFGYFAFFATLALIGLFVFL
jgi:hypothetical protein